MKFNKKLIMQDKTVVQCKTEEEANPLLNWAASVGLWWCDGQSYKSVNYYTDYKENTCYDLRYGGFSDLDFYESEGYKILSFEEAKIEEEVKEFTKEDLKSGMLVELNNGNVYLTISTVNGLALFSKTGLYNLSSIKNNLTDVDDLNWNIMKVWIKNSDHTFNPHDLYNTKYDTTLVYEREETPEVALDDIKLDGFTDEVIDKIADRVLYKIEESKKCNKYYFIGGLERGRGDCKMKKGDKVETKLGTGTLICFEKIGNYNRICVKLDNVLDEHKDFQERNGGLYFFQDEVKKIKKNN